MKCQICKEEEAEWAWQPFGPNESPESYTLLGSHSRGFPVIKVGSTCKLAFETGDFEVRFTYNGHHFIGKNHKVKEIHVDLWDGGTTSCYPGEVAQLRGTASPHSATMMMKTTIGGSELVALVMQEYVRDLLPLFLAAPQLVEACQGLQRVQPLITSWLEQSSSLIPREDVYTIRMALAAIIIALPKEEV